MAVMVGRQADIYIASGTGTAMTGEATTSLGSGVYRITNSARRAINPNASLTVLDGVTTVNPALYRVSFGAGLIIFTGGYTPAGSVTVTGQFLALSQAAQGTQWSLDVQNTLEDAHVFGDAWKAVQPVQREASVTFERFYNDEYFHTQGSNYYVLALYLNTSSGARYVMAGQLSSVGRTVDNNALIRENVQFSSHGQVDFLAS